MNNLLNRIQINFTNASKSYDSVSKVQRQVARCLVNRLLETKAFNPKTILDLGTGTGYIPELLLQKYPQSSYYLNDISYKMLEVCKAKFSNHPKVHYLHGDLKKLNTDAFDLIISSLALQWVENLWGILEFFYDKSYEVFAFSTLLDGTFKEWERVVNKYQTIKLHNYPQASELIHFCTKLKANHTFEYWLMEIPVSFDNSLSFIRYLKSLGAAAANHHMQFSKLKALLRKETDSLIASYKVFFGIFKKVSL